MAIFRSLILSAALVIGTTALANAQDVTMETLGAATAFDAGALGNSDISLPSSLWQGTSSARAAELMRRAPGGSNDPVISAMVRAALLSPGVPPQGDREAFEAARLSAVMKLGDERALQTLMTRNPALAQTPEARANIALSRQDGNAACAVSDEITTGRAEPKWARLRAVCHIMRDEMPAAELTRDLLQSGGYDDPSYFALLNILSGTKTSPPAPQTSDDKLVGFMRAKVSGGIDRAVAMDAAKSPQERMASVWANLESFSAAELQGVMSDLAFDPNDIAGSSSFDYPSASRDPGPRGTAQLFLLGRSGNARAIAKLAQRTDKKLTLVSLFEDQLANLPANEQAEADLSLFANAAVARRNLTNLQRLYATLEGYDKQSRIALAADSIGNGFRGGALGKDIDGRLAAGGTELPRATRDAILAMALGANPSDAARDSLAGAALTDGRRIKDGDRILLQSAAEAGAAAETVLMAATLMDGSKLDSASLSAVIRAMVDLGLYDLAGQIAARDFIDTL